MKETLAISFIDGGETQGTFAWCLASAVLNLQNKINVSHILRSTSCNIALNRGSVLQNFLDQTDADWLLCLDTDIVFTADHIEMLWNAKSEVRQVVSGVYFLVREATNIVPVPMPCIFRPLTDSQMPEDALPESRGFYHPLPDNEIVEISRSGFGFLLMSRSVVEKVLALPIGSPFSERFVNPKDIVGEDFVFFEHLDSLNITSYAHTGVIVDHEKTISIGKDYYLYFHQNIQPRMMYVNE